MLRLTFSLLLSLVCLSSCDKLLKRLTSAKESGSIANEVRISSPAKPEIVAAFTAIDDATREHNRVLIQHIDRDEPASGLAYTAGLNHLYGSARSHTGLAKQIINAVVATQVYEKDLFSSFDTMLRQMKAMPGWSKDAAVQRRGYIQIIDQEIATCETAIAYLERSQESFLRRNFDKQAVPGEVADEFLRLRRLSGDEIDDCKRGILQELRASLQCYRQALASVDQAAWDKHTAEGKQHEQKMDQFEKRLVAEIRKQLE